MLNTICLFVSFWFFFIFNFFIYFWLYWVFVAAGELSVVAASRGYSSLQCAGFPLQWLLLLQKMGSGVLASVAAVPGLSGCGSRPPEYGSVVMVHGLNCPSACGIFLDQGSNPCSLHWQMDSFPLGCQGSPNLT